MDEHGLDYAMYRHDIERLERVHFYAQNPVDESHKAKDQNMVNVRLAEGWKVLWIGNDADNEQLAVMGIPRPKLCDRWKETHKDVVKVYNLRFDEWECPECLAHPLADEEDIAF